MSRRCILEVTAEQEERLRCLARSVRRDEADRARAILLSLQSKTSPEIALVLGVRPEHLRLSADGLIPATVTLVESLGHERHVFCRLSGDTSVIVRQPTSEPAPQDGQQVLLEAKPGTFHVFDAASGGRVSTV